MLSVPLYPLKVCPGQTSKKFSLSVVFNVLIMVGGQKVLLFQFEKSLDMAPEGI